MLSEHKLKTAGNVVHCEVSVFYQHDHVPEREPWLTPAARIMRASYSKPPTTSPGQDQHSKGVSAECVLLLRHGESKNSQLNHCNLGTYCIFGLKSNTVLQVNLL